MLASVLFFLVQASLALVAHASPVGPVRRLYPPPPPPPPPRHSFADSGSEDSYGASSLPRHPTLGRRAVDGPGPYATYVIVLADGINLASHLAWLLQGIAENGGEESTMPMNAPLPTDGGAAGGGMGGEEGGDDGSGAGGGAGGEGGEGGDDGSGGGGGGGEGGDGGDGSGGGGGGGDGSGDDGSGGGGGDGGDGLSEDGFGGPGGLDDDGLGGALSGPWDGPVGTADGENAAVSWSDPAVGMYVAVLQGVLYEAVVASPNVEAVATDDDGMIAGGPLPGAKAPTFIQQQAKAPWNIARLSSNKAIAKPSTYSFNSTAGRGVDIYILDTGVLVSHLQFAGRAKVGGNIGLGILDGNGHGTFCASVAAGSTYGSAKKANIISIKTFTDSGGGTASSVVKGVALVFKLAKKSRRPSIISLSASFPANAALDACVKKASRKGVHFVSAAGNSGADASSYSPARSPYSVTVGAIDASDAVAKFSNFGPTISLFAGGVNVLGAFIGTSASSATLSGTSMATPAVAGLIAYFISTWCVSKLPWRMAAALAKAGTAGTVRGVREGTVNLVAGNCRAKNDTCFDWSKPGKYRPMPPPPPPPASTAPAAANAAYARPSDARQQQQRIQTSIRVEHPLTVASKATAMVSRMSDHMTETMTGLLAQSTGVFEPLASPLPTDSPLPAIVVEPSNSTDPSEIFQALPMSTPTLSRRSSFRYPWT
ncbi:hypothetical protein JCM10212_003198 [Sporobolomyces blumeae]